jgi:metabolite-proton symporter
MTLDQHMAKGPVGDRRALVESVVASTIGTTIEWYDFFLYGTAAALVFPKLFFPGEDPFVGQVLSFGTFTAGFIARPVGGVLFGYLGDRAGRKSTLVATLLLMGLSTMLVGLMPLYAQIGVAAPLLLTLLRILQGIGVGGEWGGSVLLALEYGHRGRRGLYASWPQAGVPLGLLTSTGVLGLLQSILSPVAFESWGWRIPFYLSALLIVVGLLIRLRILETPLFRQLQESRQVARSPIVEVFRNNWREILLAAGARLSENSCFYLFTVYVIAYAREELGVDPRWVVRAIPLAAALEFFTIPLFGVVSDHWSRKGVFSTGCLFIICFAWPYFALLGTRDPSLMMTAVVVSLGVGHALMYSVQGALIPELFGTRLRYSGASIGYQLGAVVAGGFAPHIANALAYFFRPHFWPLALYLAIISVISLACIRPLAETSRKDISARD